MRYSLIVPSSDTRVTSEHERGSGFAADLSGRPVPPFFLSFTFKFAESLFLRFIIAGVEDLAMNHRLFLLLGVSLIVGCGSYSMPGVNTSEPDANGAWNVSFIPSAPCPDCPTPSGIVLGVTLSQYGQSLSGNVTGVTGEPSACFRGLSIGGTTFTLNGQLNPPVEAGANLFLTVTFMPTGTQAPTQMVTLQGALNTGSSTPAGVYNFPSGTSGCTQGTFNMTKTSPM